MSRRWNVLLSFIIVAIKVSAGNADGVQKAAQDPVVDFSCSNRLDHLRKRLADKLRRKLFNREKKEKMTSQGATHPDHGARHMGGHRRSLKRMAGHRRRRLLDTQNPPADLYPLADYTNNDASSDAHPFDEATSWTPAFPGASVGARVGGRAGGCHIEYVQYNGGESGDVNATRATDRRLEHQMDSQLASGWKVRMGG